MEERKLNVSFSKSGSGSTQTRISLPKTWMDKLHITADDKEVVLIFDEEKEEVILKKKKKK